MLKLPEKRVDPTPPPAGGIRSVTGRALLAIPRLSKEEINKIKNQDPDCVFATLENFRIDLSLRQRHPFNLDAQHVATGGFVQAVRNGVYPSDSNLEDHIPELFLEDPHLMQSVESHFQHLFSQYKEATAENPRFRETQRLERSARSTRRNTVRISYCWTVHRSHSLTSSCITLVLQPSCRIRSFINISILLSRAGSMRSAKTRLTMRRRMIRPVITESRLNGGALRWSLSIGELMSMPWPTAPRTQAGGVDRQEASHDGASARQRSRT